MASFRGVVEVNILGLEGWWVEIRGRRKEGWKKTLDAQSAIR